MLINYTVFFLLSLSLSAQAGDCLPQDIIEDEYLIRLGNRNSEKFSAKIHNDILTKVLTDFTKTKIIHNQNKKMYRALSLKAVQNLPPTLLVVKDSNDKIFDYINHPQILSIENNCKVYLSATPNDSKYGDLWAHQVIESEAAWDISTGSDDVIVAISDTGVDYNHKDLKDNMWQNQAELNGQTGVDDDGNGYIDDIYGYDFASNDPDPIPGHEHGTHVAGTSAARGDNSLGVTGVVWNAKIMAVKGFADSGTGGDLAALLETIYYAADNGARVINASWGAQKSPGQSERDAINYALSKGSVPVVAAGNSAMDSSGFSPAGIGAALTVGASTPSDTLAQFSNFGSIVDVIAPGTGIVSTVPGNSYQSMQGTSMAAPQVAGLASLIISINPNLSAEDVIDIIIDSGDPIEVSANNPSQTKYTYPRINAYQAALAAVDSLPSNPKDPPPCVGEDCDDPVSGSDLRELASFNSNGCSYSTSAASGTGLPIAWFFLLPLALVLFRNRK